MMQLTVRLSAEEHGLKAAFLQHFFCINITKNSHPCLVFQRLHIVKMLKIEKLLRSENVTHVLLHLSLIFRLTQKNLG